LSGCTARIIGNRLSPARSTDTQPCSVAEQIEPAVMLAGGPAGYIESHLAQPLRHWRWPLALGATFLCNELNSACDLYRVSLHCTDWHPLKSDLAGHWAVSVSGNWRLTFSFEGSDAILVDYQDYH